jgi:hypothetical protein
LELASLRPSTACWHAHRRSHDDVSPLFVGAQHAPRGLDVLISEAALPRLEGISRVGPKRLRAGSQGGGDKRNRAWPAAQQLIVSIGRACSGSICTQSCLRRIIHMLPVRQP